MTAILTAIYGGYEDLHPVSPQDTAVEWVCVTDDPGLRSEGWHIILDPRPGVHPNRAAKEAKMLPWRYTDATESVWVDAAFEVASPSFARDVLMFADPIAQFVHPWRDCIYDEAEHSIPLAKYAGTGIEAQIAKYRAAGHPEHWGLWATGVIARRHTDEVKAFGAAWLAENVRHSYQDQISHPPMLREHNLRPVSLPGDHLSNPWLVHKPSDRHQ